MSRWRGDPKGRPGLAYLAFLWASGSALLALATAVCFWLGLNFATAVSVFLVIIVLLSLMDSLISSLIFSVIAVSILNYFFIVPLFTFYISDPEDIAALLAFFVTSFAVTGLMRRLRKSAETLREQ